MNRRSRLLYLLLAAIAGPLGAHPGIDQQLALLTERLAFEPASQVLHIQRGSVYSMDGQFANALADFQAAECLGDPRNVAFELGVLYYRKGDFPQAKTYFDTTLAHRPQDAPALEYRARLLRDAGAFEAALADLSRFFQLSPQPNPGHYIAAANMLSNGPQGGLGAALAILDQGMDKMGLMPILQQHAIGLELRRQRPDGAVLRHESLQTMLGGSPEWKVRMGELLLRAGDPEGARNWINSALDQIESMKHTPARKRLQADALTLSLNVE